MVDNKKQSSGWIWLVSGMIAGFAVAFSVHLYNQKHFFQAQKNAAKNWAQSIPKKTTKTQFDFYELLPEMKFKLPSFEKKEKLSTETIKPSAPNIGTSGAYYLQVASFKKVTDADALKATLTLDGFDVFIKKVTVKKTPWYRVMIGPFKSRHAMEITKRRLKIRHIETMIVFSDRS